MVKYLFKFKQLIVLSAVIGFGLIASVAIALAGWTSAPSSPPSGNVDAPINVGPNYQSKSGSLRAGQLSGSGWNYFNNKTLIGNPWSDNRAALIFGTKDTNNSWFLGQADETGNSVLANDVFGLYSWNRGWIQNWLPNGNVGIGTVAPTAKLEVAGQIKITGGNPGANKVLTSDASGLATWQTSTGGGGVVAPHGKQRFTSSGTFTVPAGVTKVWVSMSGGGGGGSDGYFDGAGGGGGGAHAVIAQQVSVSGGEGIIITVGTGGGAGASGGTSSFGSYISTPGGSAGGSRNAGGIGGTSGGAGGSNGGVGGRILQGGTGGGSIFGAGGNVNMGSYIGAGGNGGGYGAGGAGGYMVDFYGYSSGVGAGGIGSQGFVLVEW